MRPALNFSLFLGLNTERKMMKIQQKIEKFRAGLFFQQLKIEESVFTMGIGGGCIYIYTLTMGRSGGEI
jgi:hypothetical protein